MNNVGAVPVPPWTHLYLLDYWVNCSQLTGPLRWFIHRPCVIEERPLQHQYFLLQLHLNFWQGVHCSSPEGKQQRARFHSSKTGVVHHCSIQPNGKHLRMTDLCKNHDDSPHGHHQQSGHFSWEKYKIFKIYSNGQQLLEYIYSLCRSRVQGHLSRCEIY